MARIIIIGGGVSGLSAGIYAQMNGHSAVVCERQAVAGGNLTGWKRGDYEIDNCIHWLTGTNPATSTYKMWEELGALGDVEVYQGDTLYTCRKSGKELSLNKDINRFKNDMLSISPEDKKEILSLISAIELMQRLCSIGGKDHNEGLDGIKSISRFPTLGKYYFLTAKELSERFKHPLLREFIGTFWGDDFGALALIFVFAHFCGENGGIPKYGSRGMAGRMADRFKALGGELLLKKEALKIVSENKKARSVRFADGTELDADYVVVTTDPAVAFSGLIDAPMPPQIKKMYDDPRLKRFSSVQCAFSCKSSFLSFRGDLIIEVPKKDLRALGYNRLVLREFSHEKSYAPDGETVIQAMAFCDESRAGELIRLRDQDKTAYNKEKQAFADAAARLIQKELPELDGDLRLLDVWTPATYHRYTDSQIGSYMSFILPSRAIPSRKSNRIKELSNVILATQWQQCPGGLPIAASGGRAAIETVNVLERQERSAKAQFSPPRAATQSNILP